LLIEPHILFDGSLQKDRVRFDKLPLQFCVSDCGFFLSHCLRNRACAAVTGITAGAIRELLPKDRQDVADHNEGEGSDADGNDDQTKNPHKNGIKRPPGLVRYGGTAGCHSKEMVSQMKKPPSKIAFRAETSSQSALRFMFLNLFESDCSLTNG